MPGAMPFFSSDSGTMVELIGVSAAVLGALWWSMVRRKRFDAEQKQHDLRLQMLEQSLQCAPDGWYGWFHLPRSMGPGDDDGEEDPLAGGLCSRRLAVLLGLYGGQSAVFPEVLDAFVPASIARLQAVVSRLRSDGDGFELTLDLSADAGQGGAPLLAQPRHIRAWGIRAVADDGTPLADLVWMRDVTAEDAAYALLSERTAVLEREHQHLHDALDRLPSPVWLRDNDLRITFANRAFLAAVEAETLEQVQAEERELAGGTAGRELRVLASAARASNEARQSSQHVVLGGRRRLLEITETPLPDHGVAGERMTVGLAQDMTRLETLRSTLEQEATSHAMVLHRLGTAIAIFGGDGQLHFHNTAYARLWHLEESWLAGSPTYGEILEAQRSRRLLPEVADYPAFKEAELGRFKSLLEAVEDLLHLPDGKTLRRVLTPHPLGGLLATYEDVTDRLALEASRNELIAVQRETIDHLHEAVAVFGADGRLRLCNPAFARLWGLPEDAASAHPSLAQVMEQAIPALRSSPVWDDIRSQLAAPPQDRTLRQSRMSHPGGPTLDTVGAPLPDGGILFTLLDMSDTAQVEKALRDRAEALTEADRLKTQFMANMSYELRTPLTTLSGFAEILAEEYYGTLNPRQKDYARNMAETARQLVMLIDDISDLVTLEAGQMVLSRSTFDVHAALAAVLGLTREMVRRKGLTINFDCPPETGAMVGDEARVKQVLYNLLSNAIKYTPENGQIIVAAMRDGDELVFTVADTGIGIPDALQEGLFDRFNREGPGDSGAGIGLALVKRFVELHGGSVELVSVSGQGTTVTVRYPSPLV